MYQTSRRINFSFVVSICAIFLTTQLFAGDDDDEKLQAPRLHHDSRETKSGPQSIPSLMLKTLKINTETENPLGNIQPPTCPATEPVRTRTLMNKTPGSNTRKLRPDPLERDPLQDIKSIKELLSNLQTSFNKKISLNDTYQKPRKIAISRLVPEYSKLFEFYKEHVHSFDIDSSEQNTLLIDSNLKVYSQIRSTLFNDKYYPHLEQARRTLDKFYFEILNKRIKDVLEKLSGKETDEKIKSIKEILKLDSSFIKDYNALLDSEKAELLTHCKTAEDLMELQKQAKKSDENLRSQDKELKSARKLGVDATALDEANTKFDQFLTAKRRLQDQMNQQNKISKRLKEIEFIQKCLK